MKTSFFRNYKNKPYKYLGLVRHSETLEELVLYETRYKNEHGSTWVRPKDMFYEKIEKDGKIIDRFTQVDFDFIEAFTLDAKLISHIQSIAEETMGKFDKDKFNKRMQEFPNLFVQIVYDNENPIAFKLGYQVNKEIFYSWLGGVKHEYQGLGVATLLMEKQHQWALQNHFKIIKTKSKNIFRKMISLNLKFGYDIVGTEEKKGQTSILFQKSLNT